jgi:hypothetical protein
MCAAKKLIAIGKNRDFSYSVFKTSMSWSEYLRANIFRMSGECGVDDYDTWADDILSTLGNVPADSLQSLQLSAHDVTAEDYWGSEQLVKALMYLDAFNTAIVPYVQDYIFFEDNVLKTTTEDATEALRHLMSYVYYVYKINDKDDELAEAVVRYAKSRNISTDTVIDFITKMHTLYPPKHYLFDNIDLEVAFFQTVGAIGEKFEEYADLVTEEQALRVLDEEITADELLDELKKMHGSIAGDSGKEGAN